MEYNKYPSLTFNDNLIDELVEGFTVINVEGRDLIETDINTTKINGRIGEYFNYSTIPAREIKVHFLLKANNSKEYLQKLQKLNLLLTTFEEVRFSLGDENGNYRVGIKSKIDSPPYDYFIGTGKITIYCSKPFLYTNSIITSQKNITTKNYGLQLEKITATGSANTKMHFLEEISGTRLNINPQNTSAELVITKNKIAYSNQNISNEIDWTVSSWKSLFNETKEFKFITSGMGNSVKFEYRELIL